MWRKSRKKRQTERYVGTNVLTEPSQENTRIIRWAGADLGSNVSRKWSYIDNRRDKELIQ